jgi:hypothetical protein
LVIVEVWDVDDGALEFEVLPLVPVLVEVGLPSSEFPSSRSRLSNESGLLSVRRMKLGSMIPERGESLRSSVMLIMSADLCLLRERYSGGIAASRLDCEEMERPGGRRGERTGSEGGGVGPTRVE